jgi:hypothetical protein
MEDIKNFDLAALLARFPEKKANQALHIIQNSESIKQM